MEHYRHFRELWDTCKTDFPVLDKNYSHREKREREQCLDEFFRELKEGMSQGERIPAEIDTVYFFRKMEEFFRKGLDYNDEQLRVILSPGMIDATLDFVSEAKRFDSLMSAESIFQACRNIWIMNGIQYVLGVPVSLSPSIFAYSMLYPYSDNLLDDPDITTQKKLEFSSRFEQRLKGNIVPAMNRSEEKIHELVCMIEDEWDRQTYPGVYKSLLDIHKAQTDSMSLLSGNLTDEDIFRICVGKGGASVVADGYLIVGDLTGRQEQFLYDYGAYLQLLDDLQDASEDLAAGLMTCFSSSVNKKRSGELLSRTFHLGFSIMAEVDWLNTCDSAAFKSVMKKSIDLFIIEAVITNRSFFNRWFVHKMEIFSPFRYSFIRKRSANLSPYQKILFRNIEEFAFKREKREPASLLVTA
ncbi:MAG: hypothetical protein A2W90_02650 [Bacteroidetes bacterium GWF2_42_66]|nr:MAG: hypothetical protein A2W92_19690 [Bacteroidetes bacterium GWA2_42_15]OFY01250.1 MAG: hypothetical protein A2W89_16135 [Bacteroidetes bacterium GWE2_42_39]OFY42093.1 MAG: hypothetical protein A2W90_02650 [Bacteroidetes bacterium GWF2_42_66]HCB62833.1 hypothetical protein [Bacteroidales bacterium]